MKATDNRSAARAAGELVRAGVRLACVKLADGGAVAARQDEAVLIPPPKDISPVDMTRAGDAFTAALAIGMLQKGHWLDCACLAVAAASMAVTRFGSQRENLTAGRIEPLAAELKERAVAI